MQILLADDHAMVREALLPFVNRVADDVTVIEAETLHDAVRLAKEADDLGLIILDLMMPGMDGVTGLKRIHTLFPDVPKVILSGSVNTQTIMRTIKCLRKRLQPPSAAASRSLTCNGMLADPGFGSRPQKASSRRRTLLLRPVLFSVL